MEIVASYDMGWQRRGSGRTYNSMCGHGSLMGQETKQIIDYGYRCKSCRCCKIATREKREPNSHDCRKNWTGSSKAMEASVAVEVMNHTCSPESKVQTIIMDDDTTTLSHLRNEYYPSIEKWSDLNHSKKAFTNQLYKLATKHEILAQNKHRVLKYLQQSYAIVLGQNKDDPGGVRSGLVNLVKHIYMVTTQAVVVGVGMPS